VWNLQSCLKDIADAVAAIVADNTHAMGMGIGLYGLADGADGEAWFDGADALPEGFVGDADEVCGALINAAHGEGGVGVAVHTLEEEGDVDVEDVAVLEGAAVGDAVADDFIGGGADGFGKAAVVEGARVSTE